MAGEEVEVVAEGLLEQPQAAGAGVRRASARVAVKSLARSSDLARLGLGLQVG